MPENFLRTASRRGDDRHTCVHRLQDDKTKRLIPGYRKGKDRMRAQEMLYLRQRYMLEHFYSTVFGQAGEKGIQLPPLSNISSTTCDGKMHKSRRVLQKR